MLFGCRQQGATPPSPTDLYFSERIKKLIVPVGQHIQLVAKVLFGKLFGFGSTCLVAGSQFNIYLHILKKKREREMQHNKNCKAFRCVFAKRVPYMEKHSRTSRFFLGKVH